MTDKADDAQLVQISKKLDVLTRLVALIAVKSLEENRQVEILSDAGFAPKDMAGILGTTSNAVSIRLHRIKKRRMTVETPEAGQGGDPTESVEPRTDKEAK